MVQPGVESLLTGNSFGLPGSFVYFLQLSHRWRDVVENPVVPPRMAVEVGALDDGCDMNTVLLKRMLNNITRVC